MKNSILIFSVAILTVFIFSCKKQSDCEKNNTGILIIRNTANGFNPDSIHIFSGTTDLGMVRLNGELKIDNQPVGKNKYTFRYHSYDLSEDSIKITQCNTTTMVINFLPVSDKKLKKNILPLNGAVENLGKLNIYTYEYNAPKNYAGFLPKGIHYGFMAQELKEVYPTFVLQNSNGYYSVNYEEMIPILAKGIQEQQTQIDDLKKELAELKSLVKNKQVAMK